MAKDQQPDRMKILMADIRGLGRIPRLTKGRADEHSLAQRLRWARRQSLLRKSQLRVLAELDAFESRVRVRARMEKLMAEIRALGRIPRLTPGANFAMAQRLRAAKRRNQLSESQLAELSELDV